VVPGGTLISRSWIFPRAQASRCVHSFSKCQPLWNAMEGSSNGQAVSRNSSRPMLGCASGGGVQGLRLAAAEGWLVDGSEAGEKSNEGVPLGDHQLGELGG
jgi:hypothetical protein